MNEEKMKFWETMETLIKECCQCPFYDDCQIDKYNDETCAEVLCRVYEEKFG